VSVWSKQLAVKYSRGGFLSKHLAEAAVVFIETAACIRRQVLIGDTCIFA